ncbi:hypothetical protein B296_00042371 [Ensete ventricosum]|uniref:GIL1/IRKI C-terminal domain-containing protein n=1 Tax=Ensete ventricosum TaxID=4639 RepID=A0A426Y9L8_ENSVE|nr:hypothetical protein B296_00042371 [Ensete ventricosum]
MEQVKSASKTFTSHLLSLMRSAGWDVAALFRSIIEGGGGDGAAKDRALAIPNLEDRHAKYALEAYVNGKLFQGFENETFYLEGSLSSLINPAEFRPDCFAQFQDMRGMEPEQLLGIVPGCPFGRFAASKYLAVVHDKMEESLFGGGSEQRQQVLAGAHPRTGFYGQFLRLAKAVWLLHLLAFALDPAPAHFEASRGAEFHPNYMESVARFAGGRVPPGAVVGFPVGRGFRLGNGSVVRARVTWTTFGLRGGYDVLNSRIAGGLTAGGALHDGTARFELLQPPAALAATGVRFFARIGSSLYVFVPAEVLVFFWSSFGLMGENVLKSRRAEGLPATKKVEHYTVQKVKGDGRCMFRALFGKKSRNGKQRAPVRLLYSGRNHYDLLV